MDSVLKTFYDAVSDPSWPTIQNYADFVKLPTYIKEECYTVHGFQKVKNQIEDGAYWGSFNHTVYQYQNLVYVPIPKCAHTYYKQIFIGQGWEAKKLVDIDLNSVNAFGLVLHPLTRWRKGITEWISIAGSYYQDENWQDRTKPNTKISVDFSKFEDDFQKNIIQHMINSVVLGDHHTQPYSAMFSNKLNQINWIPIEYFSSDEEIKVSIMNFCKANGHDISLPLDNNRVWDSSPGKLQILNTITDSFLSNARRKHQLYSIYSEDLKFYHNLLDNFNPTWSTINKTQAS